MCDIDDGRDNYGFPRYPEDAKDIINNPASTKTVVLIIICVALVVILIFLALMGILAGIYSWNEFPYDNLINKSVKTMTAIMFAPFYIPYVFMKLVFFKS